jgi:hypothetical protein
MNIIRRFEPDEARQVEALIKVLSAPPSAGRTSNGDGRDSLGAPVAESGHPDAGPDAEPHP